LPTPFAWRHAEVLLECARKMTLIGESALQRYFSDRTTPGREELPSSQDTLTADVLPERAAKVLGKHAAQIDRVDTHLRRDAV
jgi:hypothetical protein